MRAFLRRVLEVSDATEDRLAECTFFALVFLFIIALIVLTFGPPIGFPCLGYILTGPLGVIAGIILYVAGGAGLFRLWEHLTKSSQDPVFMKAKWWEKVLVRIWGGWICLLFGGAFLVLYFVYSDT